MLSFSENVTVTGQKSEETALGLSETRRKGFTDRNARATLLRAALFAN
jgi:hypothetical protein